MNAHFASAHLLASLNRNHKPLCVYLAGELLYLKPSAVQCKRLVDDRYTFRDVHPFFCITYLRYAVEFLTSTCMPDNVEKPSAVHLLCAVKRTTMKKRLRA